MKIDNLKALIKKVEETEQNIAELNNLMIGNIKNKNSTGHKHSCGFFVDGYNSDKFVKVIDEDILFKAVVAMIKKTEESNAKNKQMIEAMELMVSPEVNQAPLAQQMPAQAPQQAPAMVQAPQKRY